MAIDVGSSIIFWFVLVTGVPGNLIILAAYSIKKPKKSTDILIMIQAMSDLVACVIPNVEMMSGVVSCWFALIFRLSTSLGSLLLTFIIAVDRYMAVCKPLGWRLTKRQVIVIASVCMLLSFGVNLSCIWYFTIHPVNEDSPGSGGCIFSSVQSPLQISMKFVLVSACVVAFIASLYSYANVYIVIKRQARNRAEMDAANQQNQPSSSSYPHPSNQLQPSISSTGTRQVSTAATATTSTGSKLSARPPAFVKPAWEKRATNTTLFQDTSFTGGESREASHGSSDPANAPVDVARNRVNADHSIDSTASTIYLTPRSPAAVVSSPTAAKPARNRAILARKIHGHKTTKMLLVVTVIFFITWLPYIVITALPARWYVYLVTKLVRYQIVYFVLRFRVINHMINAYIYIAVNPLFRQNVKECFVRLRDVFTKCLLH